MKPTIVKYLILFSSVAFGTFTMTVRFIKPHSIPLKNRSVASEKNKELSVRDRAHLMNTNNGTPNDQAQFTEYLSQLLESMTPSDRLEAFRNSRNLEDYLMHNLGEKNPNFPLNPQRLTTLLNTTELFNSSAPPGLNTRKFIPLNHPDIDLGVKILNLLSPELLLKLTPYGYDLTKIKKTDFLAIIEHYPPTLQKKWITLMNTHAGYMGKDYKSIKASLTTIPNTASNSTSEAIHILTESLSVEHNPIPICFANWENINKNNMAIHGAETILFCNHFYHSMRNALKEDLEKPISTRTAHFPIGPCHINTVFSFNSNSIKSTAKLKNHPRTSPDESYIVFTQPNSSPKNASALPYRAHAVPFQKVFDFADTVCPEFIAMVPHDKSALSKDFTQKVNTLTTRYNTNTTHIYNITFDEFYCHITPKHKWCETPPQPSFRLDNIPTAIE